jgi:hypothetical protein
LRNFARRREFILVPIAIAALTLLFVVSPSIASGPKTITAVGQEAIWGGPNTFIMSTLRFNSGPVFVKSGTIVLLTDSSQDPHTLTLGVESDLPHSAVAALGCGSSTDICSTAGSILNLSQNCYSSETPSNTGLSSSSPCQLTTPYDIETATTGDQVAILSGQTVYMLITGTPGSIIHFMCVIHPWMQGEFIITK